MAQTILRSVTAIGVVLENDTSGLTWGGSNLDDADVIGGLYDHTDQTLFQFPLPLNVTVDGFQPLVEEYQDLSDVYTKFREVRDQGGVTFTVPVTFDSSESGDSTVVSFLNLLNAAKDFQNGCTEDTGPAVTAPACNPLVDDRGASGDYTTDLAGWAVEILVGAQIKYVLHNCMKFSLTSDTSFQKGQQATLKFEDARNVKIAKATSLTTHSDA